MCVLYFMCLHTTTSISTTTSPSRLQSLFWLSGVISTTMFSVDLCYMLCNNGVAAG
jgi:hypothetical protein